MINVNQKTLLIGVAAVALVFLYAMMRNSRTEDPNKPPSALTSFCKQVWAKFLFPPCVLYNNFWTIVLIGVLVGGAFLYYKYQKVTMVTSYASMLNAPVASIQDTRGSKNFEFTPPPPTAPPAPRSPPGFFDLFREAREVASETVRGAAKDAIDSQRKAVRSDYLKKKGTDIQSL